MFAIIQSGGRQVKVIPGEVVTIDHVDVETGTEISSDQVLLVSRDDGSVTAGTPFVRGARVVGTVLGDVQGEKIRIFKKRRRKGYRRTKGHRAVHTKLQVKSIEG